MPIAELTAAMGALKASSDIIKAVMSTDKAMAVAELKLRLADAVTSVAEARVALVDAADRVSEKDQEITRLNDALANRAKVIKDDDGYYEMDVDGSALGPAYCMRCYEGEHRLFHLSYPSFTNEPTFCPHCKTKYSYGHTRRHYAKKPA